MSVATEAGSPPPTGVAGSSSSGPGEGVVVGASVSGTEGSGVGPVVLPEAVEAAQDLSRAATERVGHQAVQHWVQRRVQEKQNLQVKESRHRGLINCTRVL